MNPNPWEGKHIWIWILTQAGPPDHIIRRAVNMGLSGLLVKAWDGGTSGLFLDQFKQIIQPARDAGLIIGAWGYSYGNNIAGEGKAMLKAVNAGADWLVIDAEHEYEGREGRNKALELGIEATRVIGNQVPLGYTTFALPQYHDTFPYREFSSFCSVCLPQVYWGLMNLSLDEVFAMCLRGLEKFKLPIAPVGQSYGEVTPGEIIRFSKLAKANNLEGISYYDWQHATEAQLDAVGKALYGRDGNLGDWGDASYGQSEDAANQKKNPWKLIRKFLERFKKDRCDLE